MPASGPAQKQFSNVKVKRFNKSWRLFVLESVRNYFSIQSESMYWNGLLWGDAEMMRNLLTAPKIIIITIQVCMYLIYTQIRCQINTTIFFFLTDCQAKSYESGL